MKNRNIKSAPPDPNIIKELWQFLRFRKRYWLAPIIFVLLFLGFLILATGSSGILSPFLYAL